MSGRKPLSIRQTMSDLHIWAGLLAGWLVYAMFLTGTASFFRDEISVWMRPELPAITATEAPAVIAQRITDSLARDHAPGSALWGMALPTRRLPEVTVYWADPERRGLKRDMFDPATGQPMAVRATKGGDFFYEFHFNFHHMPMGLGRLLAGICGMVMLVAIISGIITHKKIFTDFFTFRGGKGQRSWLDGHAALSVIGLPFHIMITYSGLVTLMVMYMPWGLQALPSRADQAAVNAEMRFFLMPDHPLGEAAALVSVADLVRRAEDRWGPGSVGRIQINNPGDAGARIAIERQSAQRISTVPQYLMFDGVSGALLSAKEHSGPVAQVQGVLYGLHMGRFSDLVTRWLYFGLSLTGTAMVASGLMLWTVKRRARLPDPTRPHFGFRLVERLNIATIAGLPLAMTGFLWANRLLPLHIAERAAQEINVFFALWALAALWALLRPAPRAWVELFALTALALALLPVLNALTTARGTARSFAAGDWLFLGFDLAFIAFAVLVGVLARRVHRHRQRPGKRRARVPLVGGEAL